MNIEEAIKNTNGRWFTVTFRKVNNEIRTMNCRTGVKKYLKDGELKYDPAAKRLIPVFEKKVGYRMVPLDRVISAKIDGTEYKI